MSSIISGPDNSMDRDSLRFLRPFVRQYREGAHGAEMDCDAAQALALSIDDLLSDYQAIKAAIATPEALHANMLRGGIPKLSIRQALHLHGEQALSKWARAESAEARIATLQQALEPFAAVADALPEAQFADSYTPMGRDVLPSMQSFRRARTALNSMKGDKP